MHRDKRDADWPNRPWIMAVLLGLTGAVVGFILDIDVSDVPIWRQLLATFLIVSGLGFAITAEKLRLAWAAIFAVGAGTILAFVGYFTIQYDASHEIAQWPFLAGIFGLLIACPLFQTVRDVGAWRFPYARLYGYVWSDAIIGAASLAFVGITFLLFALVGALFNLIGISFIQRLWDHGWVIMGLAGVAFGAASAILSEREGLATILQRAVQIILSVLAPVLASAVALFLLALLFTGLEPLWNTERATPILLACAAGALLFVNAVIGSGKEERSPSRILQISAMVLSVTILPFAVIAAVSLGIRINQYGWTPERLWGIVAVYVALLCGAAYFWSVIKGRLDFDDVARPINIKLAITICGLAILLAMPFIDFGAISTRSQLARLNAGKVSPQTFDWAAMGNDFGPSGRKALEQISKSGSPVQKELAATALNPENRWELDQANREERKTEKVAKKTFVQPKGAILPQSLWKKISDTTYCGDVKLPCAVIYDAEKHEAIVIRATCGEDDFVPPKSNYVSYQSGCEANVFRLNLVKGKWALEGKAVPLDKVKETAHRIELGLKSGKIEIRPVTRRQVFVDGQPTGDAFE